MSRAPTAWRNAPLRVRLVALFSVLLVAALSAVGGLALTLLQRSLVTELDEQLAGAAQPLVSQSLESFDRPGGGSTGDPLRPTDYAVIIADTEGSVVTSTLSQDSGASLPDVGSMDLATVEEWGNSPRTVPSQEGTGQWRVLVAPLSSGEGTVVGTAAVALPMSSVNATMSTMVKAIVAIGIGVLVAVGVATYLVVRSSLRPLQQIETTAAGIAAGDLSKRVQGGPETTEVGSLAASLNTMLGRIEESFEVQRASEEKMKRFVSDASHELRTPLATVKGYSELYRLGGIPESEIAGVMTRIEGSATRMEALVHDLLTLARLDESAPPAVTRVPLAGLLQDAAAELRALDPERRVTVEVAPDLAALAEEAGLRRVLTNLLGNAAKYTPSGSPVEILAHRVPADALEPRQREGVEGGEVGEVVIEVRDHGPGVPERDRARIFERFARLDSGRTRDAGGTGLGLSIVASLVAAMSGEVACLPTPGGGATMQIRLPSA
ncbi:sensor histidine kinase [Serinibacter salmoneus]|uniref:histidine kinase n=1 Tax=Serinibacter salmoneus TaxID=556530 RepID=A0A2A9D2P2_9MICO|nr:HAMP domain-containing sensor histidine kinase [Serinibacter salmoneus]PFG20515.1 two-component system OmpR family sensor kinase [Serinibacter salmoneus]